MSVWNAPGPRWKGSWHAPSVPRSPISSEERQVCRSSFWCTLLDGPVGRTLADHIAARRVDLVVMATHGRGGLSRAWLGSVASDLVRHSTAPLLLMKPEPSGSRTVAARPFTRVLIPLDGSPASEEAVEHALAIAGDPGVEYRLLNVIVPIAYVGGSDSLAYPGEPALGEAAQPMPTSPRAAAS